jgi:hypothetical protein
MLALGAIFASVSLGAMEARALLLGLPFLTLALAMVLVRWRMAAPAVVAAHVLMSWPAVMDLYTDRDAWRLRGFEWSAALRVEPEDIYLRRALPGYSLGRDLERMAGDSQRILALSPFQRVYHSRNIVDPERTGEGRRLREVVWAALLEDRLPVARNELRFTPLASLRLTPEPFDGRGRWGVNEIRAFRGEDQIEIVYLDAQPNLEDAQYAHDGNPATRWTSGRTSADRMTLALTAAQPVDRLIIDSAPDQARRVTLIGAALETSWAGPPAGLGGQVVEALRNAGIDWVLAAVKDPGGGELAARASEWGLRLRASQDGYVVFELP